MAATIYSANKEQRQAWKSNTAFSSDLFMSLSLLEGTVYCGRQSLPLSEFLQEILSQTCSEACLLINGKSSRVDNQGINHHTT